MVNMASMTRQKFRKRVRVCENVRDRAATDGQAREKGGLIKSSRLLAAIIIAVSILTYGAGVNAIGGTNTGVNADTGVSAGISAVADIGICAGAVASASASVDAGVVASVCAGVNAVVSASACASVGASIDAVVSASACASVGASIDAVVSASACASVGASAVPDAVLRASGNLPAAKTDKTIRAEKELDKLTAQEKVLKEKISDASFNRAKLLAQKRAELKQARQARDDVINAEIAKIKEKKVNQTTIIKELKAQLAIVKKHKNKAATSALELTIVIAEAKLKDINAELKRANEKLTKSYNEYKAAYDKLTKLDEGFKKILDNNADIEKKIKEQKEDFRNIKAEYNSFIKSKDFLSAERRMDTLVFIQTGVNDNYAIVLEVKLIVKSDYYEQIVNYKV